MPANVVRSRIRQGLPASVVLALTIGVLTGCGGVHEQTVGDDGLVFFVHGDTLLPSGGADAQIVGVLAVASGCVLLEEGGDRYPVVWPNGTSVSDTDPLVIELPSGEQLRLGERVNGGGGYSQAGELDIDVPEECLNEFAEVAVFNPGDDPVPDPD